MPWPRDETLVEALQTRAAAGQEVAIWFESAGSAAYRMTCAELLDRTRQAATRLRELGVGRGDPVVVVLPTGVDFPVVFYGILAVGGVVVPLYPPTVASQAAEFSRTLRRVLRLTQSRTVVTIDFLGDGARGDEQLAGQVQILSPDQLKSTAVAPDLPRPRPDDLALIQFSSGTTGVPKGICLSHRNILANIYGFQQRMEITSGRDLVVSWLPLYHDMGLIGAMVGSMVTRIPLVLASPLDFLREPSFWFRLLSEYKATIALAPQFAFNLCMSRVRSEQLDGVDLSHLRVLLNGAEPIRAEAVRSFVAAFAPYGLRESVVTPCYGLAENALAATMARPGDDLGICPIPGDATRPGAVSVGPPIPDTEVVVANAAGDRLPENAIGEVMVRSASVGQGLLSDSEMAPIALADDEGWLHTGDLGFLADGELHVVGRQRDLILSAGRNLYPQDLEEMAAAVSGLRAGRVIAFGIEDELLGTQSVVLAAETRSRSTEEHARLATQVRHRLREGAGIVPRDVVLLPVGKIPLTTSGKLQRGRMKQAYLAGELGTGHLAQETT